MGLKEEDGLSVKENLKRLNRKKINWKKITGDDNTLLFTLKLLNINNLIVLKIKL